MMDGKAIDDAIKTIAYHYGRKAQSMKACGIPEPEVSERIDEKLKRQLERISMPGTDLSSAQYLAKEEADRLLARLGGKE